MRPIILFSVLLLLFSTSCATRVVTRPAKVTVVKTAPKHYKIVKINGKRYYFWNGNHYKKPEKDMLL